MIYTVTFNPSLDYILELSSLEAGKVNRTDTSRIICGGKGINVSAMLRNLGTDSIALGFIAGFTGIEIERQLTQSGINTQFITLSNGTSRINVKIESQSETEINAAGPPITSADFALLCRQLDNLEDGDVLVLSGSAPSCLGDMCYAQIMQNLQGKNIHIAVDACGSLLTNTLKYRPFLIKPNEDELNDIFGSACKTENDIIFRTKSLQAQGARNVLVSLGRKGALLLDETGGIHKIGVAPVKAVSTTCAGDVMLAAFLNSYLTEGQDYSTAFLQCAATSIAAVQVYGVASADDIPHCTRHLSPFNYNN